MVYADTTRMLADLWAIVDGLPSEYDQNIIESLYGRPAHFGALSIEQYNLVLRLYNKHIAVPAGTRHINSERHYG